MIIRSFSQRVRATAFIDRLDVTSQSTPDYQSITIIVHSFASPVVAGLINRFGCRLVAIFGGLLASAALFISSFATNMDFLLCTFGVLAGASFGLFHLPAMISVNLYFNRRRAMANGIAVVYHWSNTFIIFAGLLLHCVALACLYRPLLPVVKLCGVNTQSVPEGLDDLIAEELNSCFFTSNGYIRSAAAFASNGRISQPLVEVDEPMETKALSRNEITGFSDKEAHDANSIQPIKSNEKKMQMSSDLHQSEDECESNRGSRSLAFPQTTSPVNLIRTDSNKSALSAPIVVPACVSDEEHNEQTVYIEEQEDICNEKIEQPLLVDKEEDTQKTETETSLNLENQASDRCQSNSENQQSKEKNRPAGLSITLTETSGLIDAPLIKNQTGLETKIVPFGSSSHVSCILSTPCLGGFYGYADRNSGIVLRSPIGHQGNRLRHPVRNISSRNRYRLQQQSSPGNNPISPNAQSFSSRLRKNLSGIPTIEEGHVLEHVSTNATDQATADHTLGVADSARDYSSSITVAGITKEFVRRHQLRGSPSIISGALHQSAFSGLTTSALKIELVRMDDKPAVVVLPHPDVSIRDYSRPMYRSDIFYSGNVDPALAMATCTPTMQKRPRGVGSQSRLPELFASAFSLRPDNMSRRMSVTRQDAAARVPLSVDPETTLWNSQPNWYESYLISLTRIPVGPVDYTEHPGIRNPCNWNDCCGLFRLCCGNPENVIDDAGSVQPISICDCCLTCIRRLRDCRFPLGRSWSKSDVKQFKKDERESSGYSNKFDAAGDVVSETASNTVTRQTKCHRGLCVNKSFMDILKNMTDLQLIRNKGYRLAFIANFFAILGRDAVIFHLATEALRESPVRSLDWVQGICELGTYVPLIYVTDFAVQNGIPANMCSYLISIMGLVSIVGRLSFAWIIGLFGIRPIIVQTITSSLLGLLIALMPLFVTFSSQATAFGLMGLLSGPLASLSTIILCDLVGVDALTTAVGLVTLSRGLSSVLGAPLAGTFCKRE
ncbi:unnamed protein product [Echinostoma caproni]|uniref:MFS domain-containing protein n=1 Tax=Echinostoma caproni TaxID=27848 RepID=A0A183A553_9TREM|nr:unnamed protein product [Echinostoma caproni]